MTPSTSTQPLRVLLVDDSALNRRVIGELFGQLGVRVQTADGAREALEWLANESFDLIFMDLEMPELDGLEATARIRQQEQNCRNATRTPIIALTASTSREDRKRCLASGMDDHLGKPFTLDALTQLLQRWAPSWSFQTGATKPQPERAATAPPSRAKRTAPPTSALVGIDRERLLEAVHGDWDDLRAFLPAVEHQAVADLATVRTALAGDRLDTVRRAAHRLSGTCSACGLDELAVTLRILEDAAKYGSKAEAEQAHVAAEQAWRQAWSQLQAWLATGPST